MAALAVLQARAAAKAVRLVRWVVAKLAAAPRAAVKQGLQVRWAAAKRVVAPRDKWAAARKVAALRDRWVAARKVAVALQARWVKRAAQLAAKLVVVRPAVTPAQTVERQAAMPVVRWGPPGESVEAAALKRDRRAAAVAVVAMRARVDSPAVEVVLDR